MRFIRNFFVGINILLVIVTLVAYLTPYVNPKNIWILTFLGIGYPWLLLLNVIFTFLWLLFKRWHFLISLICILIGWQYVIRFCNLNITSAPEVKDSFTLMSNNISCTEYITYSKDKEKAKKEYKAFIDQVNKVDIFVAQEVTSVGYKYLKPFLDFPYSKPMSYHYLAIFSNYPILKIEEIDFENTLNSAFWADLDINGKTVRLYNLHLQSSRVSADAIELAEREDLQNKESLSNVKSMISKVKYATKMRATQAQKVADHIKLSPHPVIVVGDFNDTPLSYTYQVLAQNLNDTFVEKGNGIATTYGGVIPALRIDYILTDPSIQILDHQTSRTNFSDHYPITSRLAVP